MAAHGAEVRIDIEIFVVVGLRSIRIEGELEVLFPIERGPRLGQLIILVT